MIGYQCQWELQTWKIYWDMSSSLIPHHEKTCSRLLEYNLFFIGGWENRMHEVNDLHTWDGCVSIHVSVVFDSWCWRLNGGSYTVNMSETVFGHLQMYWIINFQMTFPSPDSWSNFEEQHSLLWHGDGFGAITQRKSKIWLFHTS